MPKVLIDGDDLSDSKESDDDYEENFLTNENIIITVFGRQINFLLGNIKYGPNWKIK